MIRAFILDDEERACNILKVLIQRHVPEITEIAHSTSPEKAIGMIQSFKPSLLFLDIKMPHWSGFDFLSQLGHWDFDVIFTTAFDQYAIRAIRFSALDYLMKPIDVKELSQAVKSHLLRRERNPQQQRIVMGHLLDNLRRGNAEDFKLVLTTQSEVYLVAPAQIVRCEGERNYTWFHFSDRRPLLISKTLKEFEDVLSGHAFCRIHKSHLVNLNHINRLDKEGLVWLTGDSSVPVARRKKENLLAMLKQLGT